MLQSEAPTHTCTQSGRDISVPTPGMTSLPVLTTHSRAFGVCVCVSTSSGFLSPLPHITPPSACFPVFPGQILRPDRSASCDQKAKVHFSPKKTKKSLGRRRRGLFLLVLRFRFSLPLILISCCTFLNLTHFGGERSCSRED